MKLKAKYKIIISMIDLLEDYPFEQISIKMICAKCKINRSTFYDNFQDKYDLLSTIQSYHLNKYEKLLKALSNNFHNIKKEPEKVFKFFHIILKYIYRKKSFFHAIFISNPNRSLVMDYLDITKKYYAKILVENETLIQNRELFISYTISGQIGVILYWLRSGCQESPKEVANSLLSNTIKLQR